MMSDTKWAPDRIWLQRGMGDEGWHTWCENSIGYDSIGEAIEEVEYVRRDAAPVAPAEDNSADGELIADLIEQNRALRARLDSAQKSAVEAGAEEPLTFAKWFAENCPEYQRQSYSAADMESNVRGMAYEAWNAVPPAASAQKGLTDEQIEGLRKALSRTWQLGQTYWQQADSEFYSQNAKSEVTRQKYLALVEETVAALLREVEGS